MLTLPATVWLVKQINHLMFLSSFKLLFHIMFFSDLEIDVEMWRSDIPFLEGCDNYSRAHVEPSRLTFDVPDSAIDDNGKQIILISI